MPQGVDTWELLHEVQRAIRRESRGFIRGRWGRPSVFINLDGGDITGKTIEKVQAAWQQSPRKVVNARVGRGTPYISKRLLSCWLTESPGKREIDITAVSEDESEAIGKAAALENHMERWLANPQVVGEPRSRWRQVAMNPWTIALVTGCILLALGMLL